MHTRSSFAFGKELKEAVRGPSRAARLCAGRVVRSVGLLLAVVSVGWVVGAGAIARGAGTSGTSSTSGAAATVGKASVAGAAVRTDEPEPTSGPYIRVQDEQGGRIVRLQTAAKRFAKPEGGASLHLVAAVHIGDREFYKTLQASLDAKDVVLFEGVRPPGTGKIDPDADIPDAVRATITGDRLRIVAAAAEFLRERDGAYPQQIEDVSSKLGDRAGPFVRDLLSDGWGTPLVLEFSGQTAGTQEATTLDVVSRGADGVEGGEGIDADIRRSSIGGAENELFHSWLEAASDPDADSDGIQQRLAHALGLTFQLDEMDHSGPNWRSSDLSMDQLQTRLKESGADGSALFGMLSGGSLSGKLAKFFLGIVGSNKMLATVVKVAMLDMLSQADAMLDSQPGDMGKLMHVILHDRNDVVLNDLRRVLRDEPGHASIAVIYGGGHMAGLEAGVREMGFDLVDEVWLNAITVDTRESGMGVAEVNAMRAQMRRSMQSAIAAQSGAAAKGKRKPKRGKSESIEDATTSP